MSGEQPLRGNFATTFHANKKERCGVTRDNSPGNAWKARKRGRCTTAERKIKIKQGEELELRVNFKGEEGEYLIKLLKLWPNKWLVNEMSNF